MIENFRTLTHQECFSWELQRINAWVENLSAKWQCTDTHTHNLIIQKCHAIGTPLQKCNICRTSPRDQQRSKHRFTKQSIKASCSSCSSQASWSWQHLSEATFHQFPLQNKTSTGFNMRVLGFYCSNVRTKHDLLFAWIYLHCQCRFRKPGATHQLRSSMSNFFDVRPLLQFHVWFYGLRCPMGFAGFRRSVAHQSCSWQRPPLTLRGWQTKSFPGDFVNVFQINWKIIMCFSSLHLHKMNYEEAIGDHRRPLQAL